MKLIIEGLWGVGKTTLCRYLESQGFELIAEPDIKEYSGEIEINQWFKNQHKLNASLLCCDTQDKVLERSIASLEAYNEVTSLKEATKDSGNIYACLDICLFLQVSISGYEEINKLKPHNIFKRPLPEDFFSKFQEILLKRCIERFGKKRVKIINTINDQGFVAQEEIIKSTQNVLTDINI